MPLALCADPASKLRDLPAAEPAMRERAHRRSTHASWHRAAVLCLALAATPAAAEETDPLADEVARMGRIGGAFGATFSNDGTRIAFLTNLSGVPQAWVMPAEGGYPRQVTAFEDPVGNVAWSRDDARLAFDLSPGGGLNTQVYLVRPDGGGLERITAGGQSNNFFGRFEADGRLSYSSNVRDPAASDAYLHDLASGTSRRVATIDGRGSIVDVTRDGRFALIVRTPHRGRNVLSLVDTRDGSERPLSTFEGPGSESARFAVDGRAIYVVSNDGRDRIALAKRSFDAGEVGAPTWIATRDDAELQGLDLDRQGQRAVLLWNVAGRSEIELLDLATRRRTAVAGQPHEIVNNLEFSPDGTRLLVVLVGTRAPSDVWLHDIAGRSWRQLTFSPHPGVDLDALVRPELRTYKAHDGLELSGWLYLPPDFKAPGPVVLSFHGGPEGQERPVFRADYQALLARGIAVFGPNIRGSSGFGKRFVNLDNGPLRADANRDIKASADFLVESGIGNAKRLGIMGGSYGGYVVMVGLTAYPDTFAAGANLYGVVNFETFFAHTQPWMAAVSKVEYGDPVTQREMLRELSPIHRIDRIVAPTLVLHGANDTNVPVIEAEQVVKELERRKVPVQYVLFPDEGHGWRKTPNRIRATVEIVRFFERRLLGDRPVGDQGSGSAAKGARTP
jgi:dipeptidyl aminopeptidase/acylaminoacyl peptidase